MPCLNQLRLIELDDILWVTLLEILPIEIQIQSDCFWPGKFGNHPINLDEILISIEATHHWLIFKLTSTWQDGLKLLQHPNHHWHCSTSAKPRSALCFISLIKSLNLAGLREDFAVKSSTFQSLLIVKVPITICTLCTATNLSQISSLFYLSD